ncbi:MAG: dienelactone hydrolase family protein [Acidimicrobiaceae bacterium]|nr:dienelactone hydrolase family protein [Acidimicrobiaceae bacterium]
MTTLTASDGHTLDAYEVHPDGATASMVVIQEIFGVNAHIRSVADGYAAQGYHVIAPAMFDRVERGVELGYDADGIEAGRGFAGQLGIEQSMLDVAAAIEHVAATGPVGIVGYCYGGTIAWLAANATPVAAAVGYYGGGIHGGRDKAPAVPVMLHFGALDAHIPLDGVHEVAAMYPDVQVHVYDNADHGFNCDVRGSSHPESAAVALERTLEFFRGHGVG